MLADLLDKLREFGGIDRQAIADEGSVDQAGIEFDDRLAGGKLPFHVTRPAHFLGHVAKRLGNAADRRGTAVLRHESGDRTIVAQLTAADSCRGSVRKFVRFLRAMLLFPPPGLLNMRLDLAIHEH